METDRSEGWDAAADRLLAARSTIGTTLVLAWARDHLPLHSSIVDIGCGSGMPISGALVEEGYSVFGIDASATLIAAFRRRFPDLPSACEAAQDSSFFHRTFDAAVAIGLLFLLSERDQEQVIRRAAASLRQGGRFLFSAPRQRCAWRDLLTGRMSRSLGEAAYAQLLDDAGMRLMGCAVDEGGNHYLDAAKLPC